MKHTILALAATLTAVVGGATGASAATCADRNQVVSQLETRFGETLIANSVSRGNNVLEIYASENAATWSVLITIPDKKLACLAATGKGQADLTAVIDQSL